MNKYRYKALDIMGIPLLSCHNKCDWRICAEENEHRYFFSEFNITGY